MTAYEHGNERRYYLDRALWGQLLGFQHDSWPTYRDWPRLLGAVRQISRWLRDPALDELTPYMLASNARTLIEQLEQDLAPAGLWSSASSALQGEHYWQTFTDVVERVVATLDADSA